MTYIWIWCHTYKYKIYVSVYAVPCAEWGHLYLGHFTRGDPHQKRSCIWASRVTHTDIISYTWISRDTKNYTICVSVFAVPCAEWGHLYLGDPGASTLKALMYISELCHRYTYNVIHMNICIHTFQYYVIHINIRYTWTYVRCLIHTCMRRLIHNGVIYMGVPTAKEFMHIHELCHICTYNVIHVNIMSYIKVTNIYERICGALCRMG